MAMIIWQSKRSVTPPCPGMVSPKSFILNARLKPLPKKPPATRRGGGGGVRSGRTIGLGAHARTHARSRGAPTPGVHAQPPAPAASAVLLTKWRHKGCKHGQHHRVQLDRLAPQRELAQPGRQPRRQLAAGGSQQRQQRRRQRACHVTEAVGVSRIDGIRHAVQRPQRQVLRCWIVERQRAAETRMQGCSKAAGHKACCKWNACSSIAPIIAFRPRTAPPAAQLCCRAGLPAARRLSPGVGRSSI